MAYMSQEMKKELAPGIKAVLKKYGMKGSIAVRHHSTLVVNLRGGPLDIIGNYNAQVEAKNRVAERAGLPLGYLAEDSIQVNHFWIDDNYSGQVRDFLNELKEAMMVGNHDNSDLMTDYFDVGWYIDINVGRWNKPYQYEGVKEAA